MKKIIICILIFVLSVPCAFVYGETVNNESFNNTTHAREFFESVFPYLTAPSDGDFTRGEFVNFAVNIMTDYIPPSYSGGFLDIGNTYEYGGAIGFAESGGLISKTTNFYPDTKITFNQALKIAVCAAGYSTWAEIKGGYPEGYIICAHEAGISDGLNLSGESYLSYDNGLTLLYNMATIDMLYESSVGNRVSYTTTEGVNMLSMYKNIKMQEGRVTGNEYTFLNDYSEICKDGYINIEGVSYKTDKYKNLLGQNLLFFYKDNNTKDILYAKPYENTLVEFVSQDDLDFENGSVLCYGDGAKAKKYKMNDAYSLIYNGKSGRNQNLASYIDTENAKIKILDNNNDGSFDIAFVDVIEYAVVSRILNTDRKIYDKYTSGGMIDLSDTDIKINVYLPDGTLGEFEDINEEAVIGIAMSEDGLLCTINLYDKFVKGIISGQDGNKVQIGDGEYVLSSYYQSYNETVDFANECVYFLGEDNIIVDILKQSSQALYGYFVDVGIGSATLETDIFVKIFDSNGDMLIFELPEKLRYNGETKDKTQLLTLLTSLRSLSPKYKVIKFKLNSEGLLSHIYTVEESFNVNDIELNADFEARPKLNYSGNVYHRNGINTFSPSFHATGTTIFMNVPNDYTDDKSYGMLSSSSFGDNTYTLSVYDLDLGGGAGFVLQVSTTNGAGSVNKLSPSGIVERVYTTTNDEGVVVPGVQLYSGNTHRKYTAKDDAHVIEVLNKIRPGDIIRFTANNSNVIYDAHIDFVYSTKTVNRIEGVAGDTGLMEWIPNGTYHLGGLELEYIAGKIYSANDNYCIITSDGADFSGDVALSDTLCVNLGSNVVFTEIEKDRSGTVTRAYVSQKPASYIESYKTSGDKYSYLVSRQRFRAPSLSIIYME